MRFNFTYGLVACLALLSACEAQSDIQARYISKQGDCRSTAEDQMEAMPARHAMSAKQRNAALVDHFSTCMIKAGWHVARPVKNPLVPTPRGANPREAALPAQPLPGQPSNVITSASPSSPPNEPVKTESSVLQPGPGQPVLNQPATSNAPVQQLPNAQAPATYQRSYAPANTGQPSPGRQF